MGTAFLLTGGNLGNREMMLGAARKAIARRCGRIAAESSLYETAPWGNPDQPNFYNQVLQLETELPPVDLLRELLKIEEELGRVRDRQFGPRTIDIDILFYDDLIIRTDGLTIPHPRLYERRFVLMPLAELAPLHKDPHTGHSFLELLELCTDPLEVHKIS